MVATGWVVVQSTWLKRESVDGILKRAHFSGEREREIQEERGIQKDGAFKSGFKRVGRSVSWVFNLGLLTPPNGCLDQLDPMLALGAALLLHPINKSMSWSVTLIEFYIFLQSILLDVISITRI